MDVVLGVDAGVIEVGESDDFDEELSVDELLPELSDDVDDGESVDAGVADDLDEPPLLSVL